MCGNASFICLKVSYIMHYILRIHIVTMNIYEQSQTRNSAIIIRIFPHEAFEGRLEDRSSQS